MWANFLALIACHGKSQVVGVELFRRPVVETRMRPVLVVVAAPARQRGASFTDRREQRLIETLVALPGVEALDEGVLLRLCVLVFQRSEPLGVRNIQSAQLSFPSISRSGCKRRMLRCRLAAREERDDLFFREPALTHHPTPLWRWRNLPINGRVCGDQMTADGDTDEEVGKIAKTFRKFMCTDCVR